MDRPFVFINVAMTADGKIDTVARKGAAISSQRDKERVDRLRAESDAVMVGGRTLLDEDPKLTVKSDALRAERVARGLSPNPMKVGIVTDANLDPHSKFLHEGAARVVIFTTMRTSKDQLESLRSQGVEVFVHAGERVDVVQALQTLKELGVKRLMVEGGATLNFELLRLGLVDEIMAHVAPMIFGGASAPTLAAGLGFERGAAVALNLMDVERWDDGGVLLKYSIQRSG
jgi:2,5-diamino-6-(ribosylamino)-4(3H)-pyrimidinone 5'-phosphate reductase